MALHFKRLSNDLGAEATGIDLASSVSVRDSSAFNQAFTECSVLVIRNQVLTPHQMLKAVKVFGDIFEQHNKRFALPECPQIHYISNQDRYPDGRRYIPGEGYHTDHSNDECPPKATVLHAVKLPDRGGNTQFLNMQRAYDDLSNTTKEKIDTLRAVHVYQASHSARRLMSVEGSQPDVASRQVIHPLVRTHPETGRKAIYINPIRIEKLVGVPDRAALSLLDELLAHATQSKYQYDHTWQPGDLVIWDNRCLLHKANSDYDHRQKRYLYRVMLKGDRPR
ncbi:MAG: TauD/TfdA dioxygenase family protein [Hyphomicrobiaceae bacterium]